jgi:hypothetical protein
LLQRKKKKKKAPKNLKIARIKSSHPQKEPTSRLTEMKLTGENIVISP